MVGDTASIVIGTWTDFIDQRIKVVFTMFSLSDSRKLDLFVLSFCGALLGICVYLTAILL